MTEQTTALLRWFRRLRIRRWPPDVLGLRDAGLGGWCRSSAALAGR
jgi:hypothetical protein